MRKFSLIIPAFALSLVLGGWGPGSCSGTDVPVDTSGIEQYVNCAVACGAYRVCLDASFDVAGCIDGCKQTSEVDSDYAAAAAECTFCIQGEDCADGVFTCAEACDPVVP